jgi:hypothetical protein
MWRGLIYHAFVVVLGGVATSCFDQPPLGGCCHVPMIRGSAAASELSTHTDMRTHTHTHTHTRTHTPTMGHTYDERSEIDGPAGTHSWWRRWKRR